MQRDTSRRVWVLKRLDWLIAMLEWFYVLFMAEVGFMASDDRPSQRSNQPASN